MDESLYQNYYFFKFLSKATAFCAIILEKIICGGPGTMENIVSQEKHHTRPHNPC